MAEMRVYGPPGTGKTTYLSGQIGRAAETYGADRVMVASFTKAAAHELNTRGLPVEEHKLGTLHAICYRLIRMAGFSTDVAESPKWLKVFNDWQREYAVTTSGDIDEPMYAQPTAMGDAMLQGYNRARAQMLPREQYDAFYVANKFMTGSVKRFADTWDAFKYEHELIDFTDMIELCLTHKLGPPTGVDIGFFDEVQDFTPLELALIRQWSEHLEYIVLAGDDDQCIYDFKGASPNAFLYPEIDDDHKRFLTQSYRMPQLVHTYSQQWISQVDERENKWFRPRIEEEGIIAYDGSLQYAKQYALEARIPQLLETSVRDADNMPPLMFLTTCGYMLDPIKHALRQLGIPYHNPYRRKRGDWNPLGRRTGTVSTAERVEAITRVPQTVQDARKWSELVNSRGVFITNAQKRLKGPAGDEIFNAQEYMTEEALNDMHADPLRFLEKNAKQAKRRQIEYVTEIIRRHGVGILHKTPEVVIGTIHSVKGGQADTVVLFPDVSRKGHEWTLSDSTVRQFYVGMTRAARRLVLARPSDPTLNVSLPQGI